MKRIYLDHSATTPVDAAVLEAMLPYFTNFYGNPSSIHGFGQEARNAIEQARATIAELMNAKESEIIFVSGGTEANNLAIKGIAYQNRNSGSHIITSRVEHKSVLQTCKALEKEGFEITYLDVDKHGMINPEELRASIRPDTILISLLHGNNEVGTINPIQEVGQIARENKIYFHSDAVQSFGKIPIDVTTLNVDLLSVSGHKIYGPKGIGALYIRRGTPIKKLIHGGSHEQDRRAGTGNTAGIVGLVKAAELMYKNLKEEAPRLGKLRDYFQEELLQRFDGVHINGHPEHRLFNNLSVSFEGCESDALLLSLDMAGIAASTGSACSSGSIEPSHVLQAMGVPKKYLKSTIRFTLGKSNSQTDIDHVLNKLEEIIPRLRNVSGKHTANGNAVK